MVAGRSLPSSWNGRLTVERAHDFVHVGLPLPRPLQALVVLRLPVRQRPVSASCVSVLLSHDVTFVPGACVP